jgi:hypothetical protein
MARLVDPETEDNREETFEVPETTEELVEPTEPEEVSTPEESSSDLPDKYRGKSVAELAEMHSNLERLMGKQSQEVGELRKAFDKMVQDSLAAKQQDATPEPELDDVDFYADPKAAFEKMLNNHPTLRNAQEVALQMRKQEALAALQSAHPDMKEVLTNKQFQEWVGKSKIRQQLFEDADKNYNYEAANELFDLWKDRQAVVKQTAKVEKVAQKQEVKKAATGSARSNPDSQSSRKIYRRRDIIELMNKDPKRYEALQPEIMKAYSEGRVR